MPDKYPHLGMLAGEAATLFDWAMDHGMTAPTNMKELHGWAEASVQHALAADAAARAFPQLVSAAWAIPVTTSPDFPANLALPIWARFASEYVNIAQRLLDQHRPSEAQVAINLANSMLNLARKAMDERSRLDGPKKGGLSRSNPARPQILQEAQKMHANGKKKGTVAEILGKKHNMKASTIRDWMKAKGTKKTGEC